MVDEPVWFGFLCGGCKGVFEFFLVEDHADVVGKGTISCGCAVGACFDV